MIRTIFATTIRDTVATETTATTIESIGLLTYNFATILFQGMMIVVKDEFVIVSHSVHVMMMPEISNHLI